MGRVGFEGPLGTLLQGSYDNGSSQQQRVPANPIFQRPFEPKNREGTDGKDSFDEASHSHFPKWE
jgi:hypothetical protein